MSLTQRKVIGSFVMMTLDFKKSDKVKVINENLELCGQEGEILNVFLDSKNSIFSSYDVKIGDQVWFLMHEDLEKVK